MRTRIAHPFRLLTAVVITASFPSLALAGPLREFPEKGAEAMAYYDTDVDNWLEGPVVYVALDDEIQLFKSLTSSDQRRQFIEWFWERRDNDMSDERNPYKIEFYKRVAQANERYKDFPRGWRSDRGRVHVVLGRPDAVRPQFGHTAEASIWTYYTVGPQARDRAFDASFGELSVAFLRTSTRGGYQIYGGFGGPGNLPLYVRDAFRYAKEAAILDPLLEFETVD